MESLGALLLEAMIGAAASLSGGAGAAAGRRLLARHRRQAPALGQGRRAPSRPGLRSGGAVRAGSPAQRLRQHRRDRSRPGAAGPGSARAARLRQAAVEELVLSARPNLGRLLDLYRREVRFAALLRQEDPQPWSTIEPALRLFLGQLLPKALAEQEVAPPGPARSGPGPDARRGAGGRARRAGERRDAAPDRGAAA